jgi:hypothetical protein
VGDDNKPAGTNAPKYIDTIPTERGSRAIPIQRGVMPDNTQMQNETQESSWANILSKQRNIPIYPPKT